MLCLRVRHYLSILVYAGLSLFIISGALLVYGCMRTLRIQPYMGGPEKWQKRGRAKRVLSRFCRHGKEIWVI